MSISVDVHLLSGKRAAVEVEAGASVESLKRRAQSALAVPSRGRLLNSSGEVLDRARTVTEAQLRSGDVLTLHVNQVHIQARKGAFAAILGDGSVVTWGKATFGGDSSAVQEQLRDVQQIHASDNVFAAILGDGSVVTWGCADDGGDSSAVQEQLQDVQQIQASEYAFAAILGDGSVVTWGDLYGGDSTAVQQQLRDVQQIQASVGAFAAIRGDGSVVTWGDADCGGDSSAVQEQLRDVQQIQASHSAFAAIRSDGSVVTWGAWCLQERLPAEHRFCAGSASQLDLGFCKSVRGWMDETGQGQLRAIRGLDRAADAAPAAVRGYLDGWADEGGGPYRLTVAIETSTWQSRAPEGFQAPEEPGVSFTGNRGERPREKAGSA
ncbi:hypothetical protein AK812_SmicGene15784 [Symbiodinium microadriaticum]|uniref:Ubiquitin-like domain-containing protein n=1 Tax=Symbiodinium microadriaticum TaxID=2951 RepID=A0A1Q9E216_SYMMI|nr:hypothetical protein AK812_SmicGene15784 [Symbiodinium microadriaticum]